MSDSTVGKYINPLTDFGFKYLFGRDSDNQFLLSFLNSLFDEDHKIESIEHVDKEHVGENADDRAMIYDLRCRTIKGESIIVEMQNRYQSHFRDRALYYMAGDIYSQGRKGDSWDYELTAVYGIFMMNFDWKEFEDDPLREDVCLMCKGSNRVFSDKLRMVFLKIPLMEKLPEECDDDLDIWMYLFKNLEKMNEMPREFMKNKVFRSLEQRARVGALSEEERAIYERSLKTYRDNYAIALTERTQGFEEGMQQGMQQGMRNMARKLKALGIDADAIAASSGLSVDEISAL